MVIVPRKDGETILIGKDITITVFTKPRNVQVKIAIEAPKEVGVLWGELAEESDEVDTHRVKPLEAYLELAALPELTGIEAHVMQSLQARIGQDRLWVEDVAKDLKMTKRTLQRQLQQAATSFQEIRDQVRFHYSVKYLLETKQSIEDIAVRLGYSDRTSFRSAFMRWTGLTPLTFRRMQ